MPLNNREYIKNIKDIMLCLQTMVKTRFGKKTKIIFTSGKYKSAYMSFYKAPRVWQFYCEDRVSNYMLYLVKDDKVIRSEMIRKSELIEHFYTKISHLFMYM